MPYDIHLQHRLEQYLLRRKITFESKKMMGGLCIMVDSKMCVGIIKEKLMVRIDPEFEKEALTKEGCTAMDFVKTRPMKGYVYVEPVAVDNEEDLAFWIEKALEFNPKAKESKKRGSRK